LKNRTVALCWLLLPSLAAAAPAPAQAQNELLKLSLLAKSAQRFTLKLDLFHGGADASAPGAADSATPFQAETLQRSIAEEIAQSVSYEGFILKDHKQLALLNVSGEFFAVGERDMILDKIKVLKIAKDTVTIEYEGQPYEIRIKGDSNG
jgi:hypothetical protein